MTRFKQLAGFALALVAALVAALGAGIAAASTSGVVISQAYGGGGNMGATYKNDFIELFNAGSAPVSLAGWSVQYTSAGGASWQVTNLTATTLQPGQYYLVQQAAGTGGTTDLPTPDAIGTIAMSGTGGKAALVSSTTALSVACPTGGAIVDFVGFSASANCFEGSGPTPAPSNTTAVLRAGAGCTDTDDNASDFAAGAPTPRNTSTALHACGGGGPTNPSASGSANPAVVAQGGSSTLTVTVIPGANPASTGLGVTADLSSIGDANPATFTHVGPNGSGGEIFTYAATVNAGTLPGAKSLPVSVVDAQSRSANTNIALTVSAPPITIMAIQGHGAASPLVGQTVTTTGNIVTAIGSKGFFIQDPNGDGDTTTSDGIYVYTGSAPSGIALGNVVSVSGKVTEFNGITELTTPSYSMTAASGATIQPWLLDDHPPTQDPTTGICMATGSTIVPANDGYQASNFACLDGMLVTMNEAQVTGATYGSGGSDAIHTGNPSGFYAALASEPRPARKPGAAFPGVVGHPEIPVWGGAPHVLTVYYNGLGFAAGSDDPNHDDPDYDDPSDFVYHAGTTFSVTGVIQSYKPSTSPTPFYELFPREMTTLQRVTPADAVRPVADPIDGMLTIGTQNFLHFFNDVADGSENNGSYNDTCAGTGADDTCPTAAQYALRRTKWAIQVCDVLKSPIVLAVQEIENRNVLADLAQSVNSRCGTSYVPWLMQGNDPGGINLGILARSDVVVDTVTQLFLNTQTVSCSSGASCTLNDRPPVLMKASWNGYPFALLAIYDRSMSGLPAKPYVGPKRAEQAAQVAQIAQAWQSGSTLTGAGNARQNASGVITQGPFDLVGDASVPLIVAGDFNAYEFSDGYADVTGMIKGTADQGANLYWFSGNAANTDTPSYVAPSPALFDTGTQADPSGRYSFNFSGLTQEIDHILLSQPGRRDFASVSNAHGNSDVSEVSGVILDNLTAARSGDHDGQVISLIVDRIFANGFDASP